jgi:hypothetical protein
MLRSSISRMTLPRCWIASKLDIAKTEELTWLNQFGTLGTFLKKCTKLIKRNKRSKTTVGLSVMFLFGLFFTNGIEAYNNLYNAHFAGIFVSGVLITFDNLYRVGTAHIIS